MLQRFLIVILCLLIPAGAAAQDLEGTWDFRVDDTTIFRFEIAEAEDGSWRGTWSRPDSFASDGNNFARLQDPVERLDSMAGYEFLGNVELSFEDNRPGAVPDIFRFQMVGADTVLMTYVGTDLEPYDLVRASEGDPIGNWNEAAIYRRALPDAAADGEIRVRIAPSASQDAPEPPALRIEPENIEPTDDVDLLGGPEQAEDQAEAAEEIELDEDQVPASLIGDDFLDGL